MYYYCIEHIIIIIIIIVYASGAHRSGLQRIFFYRKYRFFFSFFFSPHCVSTFRSRRDALSSLCGKPKTVRTWWRENDLCTHSWGGNNLFSHIYLGITRECSGPTRRVASNANVFLQRIIIIIIVIIFFSRNVSFFTRIAA